MMTTQRIEFLNYPVSERLPDPVWGIRIDNTDLRVHAADATRDLWRQEQPDESPSDRERFLLNQYDGLLHREIGDPGRHFLSAPPQSSPRAPPRAPRRSWAAPAASGSAGRC